MIDQQRFEFMSGNASPNIGLDGFIQAIPGDQKGDYLTWCSTGPWRNIANGQSVTVTVAFAVQKVGLDTATYAKLLGYAKELLSYLAVTKVVSGMAPGFERAVAEAAASAGIPFVAALAHEYPEYAWPSSSKEHHKRVLAQAAEVVYVSKGPYDKEKMKKRGAWIVDNSDMLVVLWGNPAPSL